MAELAQNYVGQNGTKRRRRRWPLSPADTVIALSFGLIALIFAVFAFLCWQGFGTAFEAARQKAQSSVAVVSDEVHWLIGSSRAILGDIKSMAATPAELPDETKAQFDAALANLPAPAVLGLYDATGNAWSDDGSAAVGDNIAGEDFFSALEAGRDWLITAQRPDAQSGEPIFVIAQRLGGDTFGGVALVSYKGSVLRDLWTPQNLGPESTVAIIRDDGWVVARYPALPEAMNLGTAAPFTTQSGEAAGTYASEVSPADGIARMVGFQRLPEFGVVAFASVSRDTALAGLWRVIFIVLWLLVPIALALLVGSLITANILRQSERTRANLEAAIEHNDVLFREIHHRVKNNLQSVASLLQMQPIPREIKANMGQRIAAMSAVHEHIYRSNDFSTVRVKDYLETLIENIRAGFEGNVEVIEDLEDLTVDKDAAAPLGLIVNEVVSNAFKHAFGDGRHGTVRVTLTRMGSGDGLLVVEDNGTGFDPDAPSRGIGRRLITALTQQIEGESQVAVSASGGARFELSFPLAA